MTQNERVLKIGVIGCGEVAERFHLPALHRLPRVKVVAVADVDADRVRSIARRFRVEHHFVITAISSACRTWTSLQSSLLRRATASWPPPLSMRACIFSSKNRRPCPWMTSTESLPCQRDRPVRRDGRLQPALAPPRAPRPEYHQGRFIGANSGSPDDLYRGDLRIQTELPALERAACFGRRRLH